MSNLENFDTIYYAAVQVFVIASANTVSDFFTIAALIADIPRSPVVVVDADVLRDRLGVLHILLLFHHLSRRAQFLAHQLVRRRHHEHVLRHQNRDAIERIQHCAVSPPPPFDLGPSSDCPYSIQSLVDEQDESSWAPGTDPRRRTARRNTVREIYESIRWCWVALALASLVLQATRDVNISPTHKDIIDIGELVITIAFDIEIAIRLVAHLPDWRGFFVQGTNYLDLVLAIGSTIIQLPAVHNSPAYPWLTIFQLARFYRVILEIPRMRPLLLSAFGNLRGLANMVLFLMLVNYLAALFAVQLLRGDMQGSLIMNFGQIFTSFLAVYQVFSSENWTTVLYNAADAEVPLGQSWIVILFFVGWFFFANC